MRNASTPSELRVELGTGAVTTALVYPAAAGAALDATLVLAHGAGAGQRSAFMVAMANGLASLGLDVVTFDFPYMARGGRLPDRAPVLEACYVDVIAAMQRAVPSASRRLLIGGKSMGGRMATHIAVAADAPFAGLVLLGYPLHPPKRPTALRAAHLASIGRPMLFVQGSRDAFGTPDELRLVVAGLDPAPTIHVVTGGDHSLKVPRTAGLSQPAAFADVQRTIVGWARDTLRRPGAWS